MADAPQAAHRFPIVGVGASAGGIEAFTDLLKAMPQASAMAIVFVLHQDPTHESNLAAVIGRSTKLPIEVIRDATVVQPGRLYIAPPNAEVSISDGVLHLHDRTPGAALIDAFFRSLAEDQGELRDFGGAVRTGIGRRAGDPRDQSGGRHYVRRTRRRRWTGCRTRRLRRALSIS